MEPEARESLTQVFVRERYRERDKAQLKLCPFCGKYVQGRAETSPKARIALRNAMVRHVLDEHPYD